ncbi:MAG TPA: DUF4126 domain-containing protein [Pseudonocardiaceae bacterium]
MIAALTGMGLAAAAGLNAYIPFLLVALVSKFSDVIVLPASYQWIESWWAIGIGSVLLLAEVVLDKIPAVDSINDIVQTVVRPATAGLLGAATTSAAALDESTWVTDNPWVTVVLGVVVAGLVHAGKATARPVVNTATVGVGAPVLSTVEDGTSIGLSLVAILAPLLVIVVLAALAAGLVWLLLRVRRRRRRVRAAV